MFASDGTSEAKKNMGPESEGHVAYCSMVGQDDIIHLVRWSKPSSPHQRMCATTCAISRDTCRSVLVPSLANGRHPVTMGTHTVYQTKRTAATLSDGSFGGASCTPSLNLAS